MPTYSEVTITFTNDWQVGDTFKIKYDDNGTITAQQWTWVASRSAGFEVSTNTPTATAGEQTAIDYESAFDLDNATGYVTTQTTNAVTIQSETLGEDFIGVTFGASNVGTATVVFSNYTPPFDISTVDFALVRSPYYISTPFNFDETTKVDIDLKIYSGDVSTDEPADPTVSLQKIRPSIDYAEFNTNISNIARQYLVPKPRISIPGVTGIIDSQTDHLRWVKYTATYTDATNTIADITGTLLTADGYGRYSEGANPAAPTSQVLTSCDYRKIDRTSFIIIPFINDGTILTIDIDSNGGEINATETVTPVGATVSTEYIQNLFINASATTNDTLITVLFKDASTTVKTLNYVISDECRYTPKTIVFKNRYGCYEVLNMHKKETTRIQTERKEFVNNYISGGTYDTEKHQIKDYSIDATETVTLNSGYVTEDENDLYRELIESDSVFFYDNNLIPVQVKSSSLEFKTRINDSLVNYTVEFKYAYWTIQNV